VISLTPLIDVVFILLIFFMLASTFLDWRSISLDAIDTPTTVRQAGGEEPLMLVVGPEWARVDSEPVDLDTAVALIRQRVAERGGATVQIQPLGDLPLQRVIEVIDRLNAAGITQLTMVRDPAWDVPPNLRR
jgi:biopolymer transport protein ExbD